jgi:hypothetical protein
LTESASAVGYVSRALKHGRRPDDLAQTIEYLSTKVGVVLLVLGAMHFLNIRIFSGMRRRAPQDARPPVHPQRRTTPPVTA